MANRDWINTASIDASMEDYRLVQRYHNNYQKKIMREAENRPINDQLYLLNSSKPADDADYQIYQKSDTIPYFVLGSITTIFVVLICILVWIIIRKFKRTKKQYSFSAKEIESQSETITMTTNSEISESTLDSTESITQTSSLADLWKRIKEDDNYQPTYAPSTSAPLAAVLQ